MEKFIGREKEMRQLARCMASSRSELVIIYGRRRIGKTFLVRHFLQDRSYVSYTGGHNLTKKEQLANFAVSLRNYSQGTFTPVLANWYEAFQILREILENHPAEGKKIVFLDEMPWIDTPKSEFVKAFELFWNGWASLRDDILFIACGSATSWMVDKLIQNRGGLHNRITCSIYLSPFKLYEVEAYLADKECQWDRYQILQCYMVFGGVPFYLSMLDYSLSLAQNIDGLFFAPKAAMRNEFSELYAVLFENADKYLSVIRCLFSHKNGVEKSIIQTETQMDNKTCTKVLDNLERCDFISSFAFFGHKKKNTIYRLTDFYTLFFLQFIDQDNSRDAHRWSHSMNTPTLNAWQGFAFELICLEHLETIKKALGISGILTSASTWHNAETQIDLLIDRADRIINLCEIKFSTAAYVLTAAYADKLRDRISSFREATGTRKGLVTTLIATYGLKSGKHNGVINNVLTMNELFQPEDTLLTI